MKTKKEFKNLKVLQEDKLSDTTMLRLRGGDGGEENPEGPIVKGP